MSTHRTDKAIYVYKNSRTLARKEHIEASRRQRRLEEILRQCTQLDNRSDERRQMIAELTPQATQAAIDDEVMLEMTREVRSLNDDYRLVEEMAEATAAGLSWYNQPLTAELELEDAEYTRVSDQYDGDYEVLGESAQVNHSALRTNLMENTELPHDSQRSGHEDHESPVTVSPPPPQPSLNYPPVPTKLPPHLYTPSSVGIGHITERQPYTQSSFSWVECETQATFGAPNATAIQLPVDSQQWSRRLVEGGSPPLAKRRRFGEQ